MTDLLLTGWIRRLVRLFSPCCLSQRLTPVLMSERTSMLSSDAPARINLKTYLRPSLARLAWSSNRRAFHDKFGATWGSALAALARLVELCGVSNAA
jgi:hypothetical protein